MWRLLLVRRPLRRPLLSLLSSFCAGAGRYEEVQEGDFLEVVTKTQRVVCHFFHRDFERCAVMDRHMAALAPKHLGTRFIKLSALVGGGGLFFGLFVCISALLT